MVEKAEEYKNIESSKFVNSFYLRIVVITPVKYVPTYMRMMRSFLFKQKQERFSIDSIGKSCPSKISHPPLCLEDTEILGFYQRAKESLLTWQ